LLVSVRDNPKSLRVFRPGCHNPIDRSLSGARTNYNRRNIFHIYEGVEIFGASQMREVNDIVGNLAAPFPQLFLQISGATRHFCRGFFLCEQAGTSEPRDDDNSEKK
jgi:hypothetical protein